MASNETYKETRYCKKCDKETVQMYESAGHERDSSYDSFTCSECGEIYLGLTGFE